VALSPQCSMSTLRARSVSLHHDGVSTKHLVGHQRTMMTSCELPPREGGGSPNQCFGHSRTRTNANTGTPARTPRVRLPRQATTAEFRVVDLIAQHDPETNPQLPRRRDVGLRESLLRHLPSIKTLQVRIQLMANCRLCGKAARKGKSCSRDFRRIRMPAEDAF